MLQPRRLVYRPLIHPLLLFLLLHQQALAADRTDEAATGGGDSGRAAAAAATSAAGHDYDYSDGNTYSTKTQHTRYYNNKNNYNINSLAGSSSNNVTVGDDELSNTLRKNSINTFFNVNSKGPIISATNKQHQKQYEHYSDNSNSRSRATKINSNNNVYNGEGSWGRGHRNSLLGVNSLRAANTIESNSIYATDGIRSDNPTSQRYAGTRIRNTSSNYKSRNNNSTNFYRNRVNNILSTINGTRHRNRYNRGHSARHGSSSSSNNINNNNYLIDLSLNNNNEDQYESFIAGSSHNAFTNLTSSSSLTSINAPGYLGNGSSFISDIHSLPDPTPEILPLDDVTNTYVVTRGDDVRTNRTYAPGDPRRPFFDLAASIEGYPNIQSSDLSALGGGREGEGQGEGALTHDGGPAPLDGALSCYTCSAGTGMGDYCYTFPFNNDTNDTMGSGEEPLDTDEGVSLSEGGLQDIPSRRCGRQHGYCTVSRVWFVTKTGNNRTEHQFSIERHCMEKCEPYCIMMGDRTKIEIFACRTCCNSPNCNTGNSAGHHVLWGGLGLGRGLLLLAALHLLLASR